MLTLEMRPMVTIRQGKMRDCTDLLTVYQTTRWYHRIKDNGYKTVEEVKDEHAPVEVKCPKFVIN